MKLDDQIALLEEAARRLALVRTACETAERNVTAPRCCAHLDEALMSLDKAAGRLDRALSALEDERDARPMPTSGYATS
jgi:hypothetical protein